MTTRPLRFHSGPAGLVVGVRLQAQQGLLPAPGRVTERFRLLELPSAALSNDGLNGAVCDELLRAGEESSPAAC